MGGVVMTVALPAWAARGLYGPSNEQRSRPPKPELLPPPVEYLAPCDVCGELAMWRGAVVKKLGVEERQVSVARVVSCDSCRYAA